MISENFSEGENFMKFQIMLRILFRLLQRRTVTAAALAREAGVSERSIRRYLEELIVSGVPLDIIRGRGGGICLPDTYKLPENFFTKEEYAAAVNALGALYEQMRDETVKSALDKLTLQSKEDGRSLTISGHILVDSGTWGDAYNFSDKLKVLEDAAEDAACLDLLYVDRAGQESRRTVEPHLLIYKQNIWYLYAWCRKREDFRLFRVGRIRSARRTGEIFARREIDRDNLPLQFHFADAELIEVRFAVRPQALPDVEEWLGIDSIRTVRGELFAEATLPAGEVLLSKILSFGDGVKVLSPAALAADVRARAAALAAQYAPETENAPAEAGTSGQN